MTRPKNPAAVALAKRRLKKMTKAERRAVARLGGLAKAARAKERRTAAPA